MGKTLTEVGRRVVAFDNRGHGRSDKFHDPAAYAMPKMVEDARFSIISTLRLRM